MNTGEKEENLFRMPSSQIMEHLSEIDMRAAESELSFIEERSIALGAVFGHIALQRKGLAKTDTSQGQLIDAARTLLNGLDLQEIMIIKGGELAETRTEEALNIGARLKSYRRELGLSQTAFGERYGVTRFTVMRAERGDISRGFYEAVFGSSEQD